MSVSSTAAIEALALFTPVIASNAVFAFRRTSRGIKAIDDDKTAYGLMNFGIAAGQTLKGLKATQAIAVEKNLSGAKLIENMSNAYKSAAEGSKFLTGLGKVVNYISNKINPIIIAAGCVKVLSAEDKLDAFDREAINLGCMFGAEAVAKRVLGMPILNSNPFTGKIIAKERESILKNTAIAGKINKFFSESQASALKDTKAVKMIFDKIPAKAIQGGLKGAFFVTASILGYKLGEYISDQLLGKEKPKKAKA